MNKEKALQKLNHLFSISANHTTKRKKQFIKYNNHVDGKQWLGTENPKDNDPQLTLNMAEDIVTIYQGKLFPRNQITGVLEIGVKSKSNNEKLNYEIEQLIIDTYLNNNINQILLEQSENFIVGGVACLYYPPLPNGETKIISIDPTSVYIGFHGNNLNAVAFIDSYIDMDNITHDKITYWDLNYSIIKDNENIIDIQENNLGYIPFSWIPCRPKPHKHEGRSMIDSIIELDREINFRASDYSKRIKENTQPHMGIYSEMDTSELQRDINNTYHLSNSDRMEYLVVPEADSIQNWISNLRGIIQSKCAVNDAVMGRIQSNTSALSIAYQMSPLLDRIGFYRIHWDEAFRNLNRAIISNKYKNISYYSKDSLTDPVYASVAISDQLATAQYYDFLLRHKLISKKDAIDDLRLSDSAEKLLNNILTEIKDHNILYQDLGKNPNNKENE